MTPKSRALLLIGPMAGFAILASVYFRTGHAPSESGNALSMREYSLERSGDQPAQAPETIEAKVAALLKERRELDETVWAQEVAAQKHEETIVKYRDRMLRPEDDKYAVLAEFPFQTITLDAARETTELDWGIKRTTFGDYNQDGALDFYVIGMSSTTIRRLNQMGLIRADRPEYLEMRTRMAYGNRMYLAHGRHAFRQPDFRDSVARSGWSWGTTSFDFDSDGDMDVYVANGHFSGKSTKDYCTRYWCHDIYTGGSQPDPALYNLFLETYQPAKDGISWDGYQKNHLFMNQSGKDFVNVAFLMNAALGDDSRSVISDDFNGDGRPDLLVTSRHLDLNNRNYGTLHLLINRWPVQNNWIGVRLQIEPGGPSTIGAVIRVRTDSGDQLAHIVTGDSYRALSSSTAR